MNLVHSIVEREKGFGNVFFYDCSIVKTLNIYYKYKIGYIKYHYIECDICMFHV